MSPLSREEHDAKITAVEAKVDVKLASTDVRFDRLDGRMDRMDGRMDRMDGRMDRMDEDLRDIKRFLSNLRLTLVLAMVSTGLATTLGIAAINSAMYGNMRASFDMGKDNAEARAEILRVSRELAASQLELTRRALETAELLRQMRAATDGQPSQGAPRKRSKSTHSRPT